MGEIVHLSKYQTTLDQFYLPTASQCQHPENDFLDQQCALASKMCMFFLTSIAFKFQAVNVVIFVSCLQFVHMYVVYKYFH